MTTHPNCPTLFDALRYYHAKCDFCTKLLTKADNGGIVIGPYQPKQGVVWFGFGKIARYSGNEGITYTDFTPESVNGNWKVISQTAQFVATFPFVASPNQLYYKDNVLYQQPFNTTFPTLNFGELLSVVVKRRRYTLPTRLVLAAQRAQPGKYYKRSGPEHKNTLLKAWCSAKNKALL